MKGKLRVDITPIEGVWERRREILEICKKAIEAWKGDYLTRGYKVEMISESHRRVYGIKRNQIPFLYLEAIEEEIPTKSCEECDGTGRVDDIKESLK